MDLFYYLHQEGHVFSLVCLLFSQITGLILMKLGGGLEHALRKNPFRFGANLNHGVYKQ